ncbi:MAG: hypothetical protein ACQEV7_04625 [Bacillota bacterium]
MQAVKQNLAYIKQTMENDTHREQSAIIHMLIEDILLSVKDHVFNYEVPYVMDKDKFHFKVFVSRSRQAKASLTCDLHELNHLITNKHTDKNIKRSVGIINKLLQNNLYQDEIHRTINKWINLAPKYEVKKKKMRVK